MPYFNRPFNYEGESPTQVKDDLNKANTNFTTLSNAFVSEDPNTGIVKEADKVDGCHASQTPTPNTIPVADTTGKIHKDWLPVIDFALNSDKVDNYHASQTPTPNTIPVAKSDSKLDIGWLPPIYEKWSTLFIGEELPTIGEEPITIGVDELGHNDLYYQTTTNTLYRYDAVSRSFSVIDWWKIVQASSDFRLGALRKNPETGGLEVLLGDYSTWVSCIPAVGSDVIFIPLTSLDNTNNSILYWIPPGQTIVCLYARYIPIVLPYSFGLSFKGKLYLGSDRNIGKFGILPNGGYGADGKSSIIKTTSSIQFSSLSGLNNLILIDTIPEGWICYTEFNLYVTHNVKSEGVFLTMQSFTDVNLMRYNDVDSMTYEKIASSIKMDGTASYIGKFVFDGQEALHYPHFILTREW